MNLFHGSGAMHDFVVALLYSVGVLFALLMAVIVIGKAWREVRDRRLKRRRAVLEPLLFKYVSGQGPIEEHLDRAPRTSEWVLFEEIFFELGRVVRGSIQERASEAFERLGFVDHYLKKLGSANWWTRAEAAEKLGLMRSEKATEALIARMEDPVAEVRVRVARALGSLRTSETLRPLIHALRDPGRWSAIRVAGILIGAGEESVEILLEEFEGLPAHARIAAIDIFGRIRSLQAEPLLLDLLENDDADVRARAAFALGNIGDPSSASSLVKGLRDGSWAVRAMSAKALGRLKEESSIDELCAALADQQWWVRANAAEALKRKGDPGMRALMGMLDSGDSYAAQQAVQMLQESGVLDVLISRLSAQTADERQQALSIMAKLVKLHRTDLLTEMAQNHPEASIRQRLSIILGLGSQPQPAG